MPELSEHSGYVLLATQVPASTGDKLAADNLPGITLLDTSERVDPDGSLAGPLLGQVHASGNGASGLEYQYNSLLSGQAGTQTLLESPAGVDLPQGAALTRSAGENGTGIELTIDQPLQYVTESALGRARSPRPARRAARPIVMDTRTGDILAMANLVRGNDGLGLVPGTSRRSVEAPSNLALTQAYEPGSVFKLVTFSAALQDGLINPATSFSVPDQIQLDGSTFHDAEPHPTEQLSATQILAQSSNIGTSEIAQHAGREPAARPGEEPRLRPDDRPRLPGREPRACSPDAAQWEPTNLVSLADRPGRRGDRHAGARRLQRGGQRRGVRRAPAGPGHHRSPTAPHRATTPSASHRVVSPSVDAELVTMLEAVVDARAPASARPSPATPSWARPAPPRSRSRARTPTSRGPSWPASSGPPRPRTRCCPPSSCSTTRRRSSGARSPPRCSPRS